MSSKNHSSLLLPLMWEGVYSFIGWNRGCRDLVVITVE
uniref:Uncharacterized protein n=1 Tax=Myoviridae sp. ctwwN25 TaxID=2825209 RepID=A0A8S5PN70_9CAUD|nr:MAG TPA: hypothetical protein [Myoviridae sp. ctwwN25]